MDNLRLLNDVDVVGFVLALASVPLAFGWIPRNRLYGFRVPPTLRDDRVWYVTNRKMGIEGIVMGLGLWALAAGLERSSLDPGTARLMGIGLFFVALIVFIVRGWLFASRVARQSQ